MHAFPDQLRLAMCRAGAYLADRYLGKYRTILYLSCVYCLGHLILAAWESRTGLYCGLAAIAVGAGGIKPCVSSFIGDQFPPESQSLLSSAFSWFCTPSQQHLGCGSVPNKSASLLAAGWCWSYPQLTERI